MGAPVILTDFAIRDLQSIILFIAINNPDRARAFGNLLIDRAMGLGNFPEMGRVVPEVGDPGLREIIQGSYRIIYRVKEAPSAVFVLRFWHAARGGPDLPEQEM